MRSQSWHNVGRAVRCVLVVSVGVAALSLTARAQGVKMAMKAARPLAPELRPVLISEEQFLAIAAESGPPTAAVRAEAAIAAAELGSRSTLGVFAQPSSGVFTTDLLIVARSLWRAETGELEASDIYIVPRRVSASLPVFGRSPQIALTSAWNPPSCAAPRGCRPETKESGAQRFATPGNSGAGLPPDIVLNGETPPFPPNAAGRRPELRLFFGTASADSNPNRFTCFGETRVSACPDVPVVSGVPLQERSATRVALTDYGSIALVSESEYAALLAGGQLSDPPESARSQAVRLAALGNRPEFMGIVGSPVQNRDVAADLLLVGRDLRRGVDGHLEASEVYVAVASLRGRPMVTGVRLEAVLTKPLGQTPTVKTPCGAVSVPEETPVCPRCLPPGSIERPDAHGLGEHRWPTQTRATLRFTSFRPGMRDPTVFSCAVPLPEPDSSLISLEACDGIDNNKDGFIDEYCGICGKP